MSYTSIHRKLILATLIAILTVGCTAIGPNQPNSGPPDATNGTHQFPPPDAGVGTQPQGDSPAAPAVIK